jgi:hypothetical protein
VQVDAHVVIDVGEVGWSFTRGGLPFLEATLSRVLLDSQGNRDGSGEAAGITETSRIQLVLFGM